MRIGRHEVDRRTLLIGGGVGVGLIVAVASWPRRGSRPLATRNGEETFGFYLKIGRDGRVTVAVPQAETGQGAWTALPQILGDELGAAWETVAVEPAPLDDTYGNALLGGVRMTAGSTSVRAFEQPLRLAGAAARTMLVAVAADRWDVDEGECEAAGGVVRHGGKAIGFGELAEAAASQRPPRSPKLRRGALAGKPLPRLDLPSKSDGSFRFAGDVRLPEMLFASARLAPPGGRLTAFSRGGAESVPGVRHLVARDAWLAVAADSWWTAERAMLAADAHFEGPERKSDVRALCDAALPGADSWLSRGDYDGAVKGSRPLSATYWMAPAMHLGLEPITATARLSGGRLEVWAPTQAPDLAREVAARAAGSAASEVLLYPMPPGEPGGRALEADAIAIAVDLARELSRPVQLTLSPAASQNLDRAAPPALAQMTALPGVGGVTAALRMRVATADGLGGALARLTGEERRKAATADFVFPYAVPNLELAAAEVALPFDSGYMRGEPERSLAFCTESFVDELARAAGSEPLAFRMALLGGSPRLAACIQAAATAASWDGGGSGSTMGLAAVSAYGSHIGLVASATIAPDQRIQVDRLVAAVDCGRIVNPQLVRQQIEGGLLWALAQATMRAPEFVAGMARSRPLGALQLPKVARTPQIVVQLIPSAAAPGGVSGLGVAPLAPAVANAIFAGTGKRLRNLPFDPTGA